MSTTVPLFVDLDYSQDAVRLCVLDSTGEILFNRAVPDSAEDLDQAVVEQNPIKGLAPGVRREMLSHRGTVRHHGDGGMTFIVTSAAGGSARTTSHVTFRPNTRYG